MRWNKKFNAQLGGKWLASSVSMTLFADFCWRSNFPIVFRRERDYRNETNVVVLASNRNSESRCVLNHTKRDFSEAQRNRGLWDFFSNVVGRKTNHWSGIQTIRCSEDNCAKELRVGRTLEKSEINISAGLNVFKSHFDNFSPTVLDPSATLRHSHLDHNRGAWRLSMCITNQIVTRDRWLADWHFSEIFFTKY